MFLCLVLKSRHEVVSSNIGLKQEAFNVEESISRRCVREELRGDHSQKVRK